MEVIILKNTDDVADRAAQLVCELVTKKPGAVLGLATGGTPIALYQRLVAMYREGAVSFEDTATFNLDEYIGVAPDSRQSYRHFMNEHLFTHIDIDLANTHLPECLAGENPRVVGAAYEQRIAAAGGIDLQILGIGANGHIGFNEPTSSLASRTRVKTLTERTIADNSRLFDADEFQPHLAMTMGIATILESRHIFLLATGEHKAKSVRSTVEGPISAMCPASALQLHRHAVMILDETAASELSELDYYRWVSTQHEPLVNEYGYFDDLSNDRPASDLSQPAAEK